MMQKALSNFAGSDLPKNKKTQSAPSTENKDATLTMDQAIDIAKQGVECKKNKMFKLAKTYFANAAEMMLNILRLHSDHPMREKWKDMLKLTISNAEECNNHFKKIVEMEKKDKYSAEIINNILSETTSSVQFEDICGLDLPKASLQETLVYPNLRPDIFTGLRAPPKGILFYGPPGNGKTMLAKAAANECKATFINISASTLVSKFVGDSEKMMKALFHVAQLHQPSIIFIDEIDSILTTRSENENDASRRLKTEFLVQADGVCGSSNERVTIIGATNRPGELDPAAFRRFPKRILIGMPDMNTRWEILSNLLKKESNSVGESDLYKIATLLEGYSSSDITHVVKEAAMEAIREFKGNALVLMSTMKGTIRPISKKDLEKAVKNVRPSLDKKTLQYYTEWERKLQNMN